jgi:5'-nucleotidase
VTGAFVRRVVTASVFALSACASVAPPRTVTLNIAAINDFHGHLHASAEPVALRADDGSVESSVAAGGVAKLAAIVDGLRAKSPNFAFVSAGDLVGATPALSAAFQDEPTIDAMNAAGLDFNGVGNHEFDNAIEHLQRLQTGGCPAGGCRSGAKFGGARFRFLAANVIVKATGQPLLPPYALREYGGIKVAFIGLTLKGTPEISSPRILERVEFRDEADTVNALVPELERQGIEAIVVLIHQGGVNRGGPNACVDFRGPIRDIAARLDRAVDLVISGHTHQAYICRLDGRLVTSAGAFGRFVTDIELTLDAGSRDVLSARAVNRVVAPDTAEASRVAEVVDRYAKLAEPLQRAVGRISASIVRTVNADGESPLGRLIADAHLEAARSAGAVVAFMNPGGVRAPLERTGDGEVTYSNVFAVYPFDNALVAMTLTGAQIVEFLEQQWRGDFPRVMQVSRGFTYEWNPAAPVGSRVVRESIVLDGRPLEAGKSYRVAVNSFMAQGGDGMTVLREGTDRVQTIGGREAIARYLEKRSPLAPPADRRIRRASR